MVEVYGLDTRSLAVVLRRRPGSADHVEPEVGRTETPAEDELPMTQAKSDIPRSVVCRSPTVEDEKIARQKHMVKLLFSDDDVRGGTNIAKSVSENPEGATASQKRRLETRRRSRELQALMNDDGPTEESPELDTVTQATDGERKSKEDQYWEEMWDIAKTALRSEDRDEDEDGKPFEKELPISLVPPV